MKHVESVELQANRLSPQKQYAGIEALKTLTVRSSAMVRAGDL